MLLNLPTDILSCIIEHTGDKRDLKSLCEASKALYVLAAAHLYGTHEVLLRAPDEHYLDEVEVEGLLRAAERSSDLLARVTNLRISAPFSERLRLRCVHDDVDDEEVYMTMDHDDNGQDRSSLQLLGSRILPILQKLQDGRLQKFSWDMGVCVPQQLLGQRGCVLTHQNRIQHLRLVTDANCAFNSQSPALALQELKSLKGISWTGLRTYSDFIALGLALQQNAHHLEALQLDFIDWELVKEHWDDMDDDITDFFRFVLRVRPQSTELRFPAMEKLSLSGLDLTSHSCGVAYAVNAASLRSVTIRRCPGWELFLQQLIEPNCALNITSLEIYQPVGLLGIAENEEEEILRNFLESISGLESLYLSLPSPTDTKALWRTAVRHKATLRRFIYHARSVNLDDESELFEEEMDLNDMALLSDSFLAHLSVDEDSDEEMKFEDDAWFTEQSPNPLSELTLECIGLACHPRRLKEVIEPLSLNDSLQVLHIRQSGPDIRKFGSSVFHQIHLDDATLFGDCSGLGRQEICEDGMLGWVARQSVVANNQNILVATILSDDLRQFADWAFGPNGVASLRLLAYGDFSCRGRFADSCFMLRRAFLTNGNQSPYQFYFRDVQRDIDLDELLDRHAEFLEACPTNALLL